MGAVTRGMISIGIGVFLFSILLVLADNGVNFFAAGFFSLVGFIAFTLWIFDYMTYFLAT
ncbi:MAG TPA: hypothetical protein VJG83_05065 [archaeon]|nr:hypothetical protein [archaeon]